MRRVVLLAILLAQPGTAHPAPWTVTGEAGTELDDNVQRVETGPGLETTPISSSVFRFGLRTEHKAPALGGAYAFTLSDLTRVVNNDDASVENVTMLAGDLKYLHPLGDKPAALGAGISAVDALPISDPVGARTFRNLGADVILALHQGEERRLTLAAGARAFHYKPDPQYDYTAPAINARLDLTLWQPAGKTRSLELATTLGFEARAYDAKALVNACPPGAPADPLCTAASDLDRRDRFARAGVELTWVGPRIASVGYQIVVIDSNSFGQSFARHRITASATSPLPGGFYGTLLAILQLDQYLDGLIVQRDLQHAEFTNIEDENRSSLQLRLAHKVAGDWSIEGRAALWRNIGGGAMELAFQRELGYVGVVYSR